MDLLIDTNRLLTRVLEWRQPAIRVVGRPNILICLQEHADRLVIFVLAACMLWWWVDKRTYTRPEGETGKGRTGNTYLKLWQLWLEYTRDVVYKEFGCRPWHETYDEVGWNTYKCKRWWTPQGNESATHRKLWMEPTCIWGMQILSSDGMWYFGGRTDLASQLRC